MIRETLGDEAVIVATGEQPAAGGVRVTAAVEPSFEIGHDGVSGMDSWLQYDEEQDTDAVAEELTEIMLRHCVPEDITDHIISCATVMGYENTQAALPHALDNLYSYAALPTKAYKKPIMMIGPPGSGKTLAVAKMAARGTMDGLNVGVISTDTVRAGGVEQLQAFTNLLNIKLQKAKTPKDFRSLTEDLISDHDQLIIDTSGLNPFDKDDVKILARLIGVADVHPVLVLPTAIDADEAGEMARVFATIGATDILPTRIDIARRLGSMLAAAHQGGLRFCNMSNTPKVAHGLVPLNAKLLSQLLVPRLYRSSQTSKTKQPSSKTRFQRTGTKQ